MRKLTLLVDMDDTLEDLLPAWVAWINKENGRSVDWQSITEWDMHKAFPDLSDDQIYSMLSLPEFWDTVRPKEGAVEYLKKLKDDGHLIYVVTSSDYRTIQTTMDHVLFRYCPYLTWNDVIVCSFKQMIHGDILIDDGVHNHMYGGYMSILMDAPHNRSFNPGRMDIVRAHDWEEVYEIIKKAEKDDGKFLKDHLRYYKVD